MSEPVQSLRKLDEAAAAQIMAELDDLEHGNKSELVKQYADFYGTSEATVYRRVSKLRSRIAPDSGRKTRSDAGVGRTVKSDTILEIRKLQLRTADPTRRDAMAPAESIIAMAEANGLIPEGSLSVSTYNRRLREELYSAPDPRIRFEPGHVNQIHYVDGSGSRYLQVIRQLDNGDFLIGVHDPDPAKAHTAEYKGRKGLWLMGIVEGHSRCRYIRYFASLGENTADTQYFLQEAWKPNLAIPFGGLPDILQSDMSVFARNKMIQQFFAQDFINVAHSKTMPYKKEGQGKIENVWKTFKQSFEQPFLAMRESRETFLLSELNDMVTNWLISQNAKAHPVYGRPKAEIWREAMARQALRLPPEDFESLPFTYEERTLNAYADFQLPRFRNTEHGGWYHVDSILARRRVLVFMNLKGDVIVRDPIDPTEKTYEARPGRRETQPFISERDADGNVIRIYENYQEGHGQGKTKTPSQRAREEIAAEGTQPLIHPDQIAAEGAQTIHFAPWQEDAPKVNTPFSPSGEFFNESDAKAWLADRLGIQLRLVRMNHQAVYLDIQTTLEATLDKQKIAEKADGWAVQLHQQRTAFGG